MLREHFSEVASSPVNIVKKYTDNYGSMRYEIHYWPAPEAYSNFNRHGRKPVTALE